MTKRIEPISQEVEFNFDEIFFSLTDKRGIILDSNKVFIRVSGYPKEEIIAKPHNIVRHPDMPKCVFELFWKMLKGNLPIVAYVKNMAADGRYYWVLALAIPVQEGYLSIRMKPQSPLFEKIKNIYTALLEKEKEKGKIESTVLLSKLLLEHGFESYELFMTRALTTEILANKVLINYFPLKEDASTCKDRIYNEISRNYGKNTKSFINVLDKVKVIIESAPTLRSKTDSILLSCNKLDYISLNMSINSGNLGQATASVSIISREFQAMVSVIRALVKKFQINSTKLRNDISIIELESMTLFLQIKTIELFFQEFFAINKEAQEEEKEYNSSKRNLNILFSIVKNALSNTSVKALGKAGDSCVELLDISNLLKGKVFSLEITKDLSRIEISRNKNIEGYFDNQINDIDNFIENNKKNISNIQDITMTAANEMKNITDYVKDLHNYITEIIKKLNF